MTRALAVVLSLGVLCGACVLPDYKIYDDSVSGSISSNADAGAADGGDTMSMGSAMFPGAEGQCAECLDSQCADERTKCGGKCDDVALPISPAMTLTDDADPLVMCMVNQCDDACNIRWGCVGKYNWPNPSKPYNVMLHITDPLTNQGMPNVKVAACEGVDPGCAVGGGMSTSDMTDADGRVSLQVSAGFYGYFLIDAGSDDHPVVAQFSQPAYRINPSFTVNAFPRSWVKVMASMLQAEVDNGAGQMIFRAENCLPLRFIDSNAANAEASEVSVSYGRKGAKTTKVFYTIGGLQVDPEATETSEQGSGYGGALNLPAGQTSIIGRHGNTDVINASIPLRADALGILFLVPNAQNFEACLLALLLPLTAAAEQPAPIRWLPLALHVVEQDGQPIAQDDFASARVARANEIFAPYRVGFVVARRLPLTAAHAKLETRADRDALGAYVQKRVIDVFVVESLRDVDEPERMRRGVHWHSSTFPGTHYVILSLLGGPDVMAHELGHYLGNSEHSQTPGNLMSYERGEGLPFLDPPQLTRLERALRGYFARKELVQAPPPVR